MEMCVTLVRGEYSFALTIAVKPYNYNCDPQLFVSVGVSQLRSANILAFPKKLFDIF